jgi:hypothetical protein
MLKGLLLVPGERGYEAVEAMTKARFSNLALIRLTYQSPEGDTGPPRSWAAT